MTTTFSLSPLLERIRPALPDGVPVYLVGGAVRDVLLGRAAHDLDFAVPAEALNIARRLADQIGAAYYPMDLEHNVGRVVLKEPSGERYVIDFAVFQGPDLESDLRGRDFTINAMAVEVHHPQALLDPLGGLADLLGRRLRACSSTSLQDDPVRILRGVRQAAAFSLKIVPESLALMRQSVGRLPDVSAERLRDELFRILDGSQPATALRALEMLGVLPYLLPEVAALKGVEQAAPHIHDVWNHTLEVVGRLETLLEVFAPEYDPDKAASLMLGLAVLRLGRYRQLLSEHLATMLTPDRSLRSLLFLAALYHDVGKPATRQVDEKGRLRFLNHDEIGGALAVRRAGALRLSNPEIERLGAIVRHHMRPLLLGQLDDLPTRRAIYRFFCDCGPAGVEVCILSLADALGTYGPTLPQEKWARHLDVVRVLLEAWWEKPEESISPPALVNGHDLMEFLGLPPGRSIGRLLEAIREAQATGQVSSREQALALARGMMEQL